MQTTSPSDWELFMKGYPEVPNCCPGNDPGPPPEGMILGPGEQIPAPQPADADGRPMANGQRAAKLARRQATAGQNTSGPYNRSTSSKPNSSAAAAPVGPPNGPPRFIGPVGYEVVK
jgi:hypothetical protein